MIAKKKTKKKDCRLLAKAAAKAVQTGVKAQALQRKKRKEEGVEAEAEVKAKAKALLLPIRKALVRAKSRRGRI